MEIDAIKKLLEDVIRSWRMAESQRTIFGAHMIQTKKALDKLLESCQKFLAEVPSFTLTKQGQAMVAVFKNESPESDSAEISIPTAFPAALKVFTELKIDSISIHEGVTVEDFQELFTGISTRSDELEAQGGLKGFLTSCNVTHITLDQIKYKLLKDGEEIGGKKEENKAKEADSAAGAGKSPGGEAKAKKLSGKEINAFWEEFLRNEPEAKDFNDEYKKLIRETIENPAKLVKILKKLLAKQKDAEGFFGQVKKELFGIGFSDDDIEAIKKKLFKPKRVLIDEDELKRLKRIEQEFKKLTDDGIGAGENSEAVEKIKKKLADETARSEAIIHQLGEGGIVLDKGGKIISVNVTAQKALGFNENGILGKTVKEILKPQHILTAVSNWQSEDKNLVPKQIQVKALNEETLAIIRESAIVIENEDGRSIGVLSVLQNIVQQEELNRRKNDILDVLGHDLRAPLGAIKMNFEVLAQATQPAGDNNAQQKRFLDNCQNSIARMKGLIEKILDTRQLETGKIMLKYGTVETNTLIEQAVTSVSEWAKNKDITLPINVPPLPNIEADAERIYQVLTNLISNALKFTPEGGTISTEGKTVDRDGSEYVEIAVKDTGMGIDQTNLTKIFDKYEQVTVNAPKGVRGLGLGLSICKAIMDLHGGRIWVESELGKGSTFTFQVPIKGKEEK